VKTFIVTTRLQPEALAPRSSPRTGGAMSIPPRVRSAQS
jgi:hypothetical protein